MLAHAKNTRGMVLITVNPQSMGKKLARERIALMRKNVHDEK